MNWKNRIIGYEPEYPLDQILFNPANWRVHPAGQQSALEGVLDEVGWVQNIIINQTTGHLVDGHLRCQLAARRGDKTVPVIFVELSEEEEQLVLATLDPITAMAATDRNKLQSLMDSVKTENEKINKLKEYIARNYLLFLGDTENETDYLTCPKCGYKWSK